jgi:periplasmic protein TonB
VSVAIYRSFVLPWTRLDEDDGLLRKISRIILVIAVLLGIAIPLIPVPQQDRNKVEALPPRLAQLMLEKQKPKPKPKPVVKKAEKKKEKKKEEKKKEEKKPKKKIEKKPEVDKVAEARKKAASTGLLAFSDELADLRDKPVANLAGKPLAKGATQARVVKRNILTSGVSGSGGIDTSHLSSGVGTSSLAGRQTTQVESPADMVAKARPEVAKGRNSGKASRTYGDVSLVFDKNKGHIYSLYSRALRKDPTLQGKVVLEITIAPSGRVTACKIVSSELHDPDLEHKLVERVKLLNFGARNVDVMVVTYPIDFLPS